MLQRINYAIGRMPTSSCDVKDDQTVLSFEPPLSAGEKTLVDAVMADNPTLPPSTGFTQYYINDIYEQIDLFAAATGLACDIYFTETVPGSCVVDRIVLQFKKTLTNSEKNKVRGAFADMIQEA